MSEDQSFPLDALRTDGWFERIGDSVASFQALCEILGERFFAFSMITGARITALTVDRRNPENTIVDFAVGVGDDEITRADTQRLAMGEFRRRLVSALVAEEPAAPPPKRATDTEAIQLHIGVRYLLLAPLFGYSLIELLVGPTGSSVRLLRDGIEELHTVDAFRERMRTHVRQELTRVQRGGGRGAIDLSRVADAEQALEKKDYVKVVELLGTWPAPLTLFLRTPEGQMLAAETRGLIAKGLGVLGSACVEMQEGAQGEEILRLAVQYAGDGPIAPDIYARLGEAILSAGRPGEAIAPLRRAVNLGSAGQRAWPLLTRALFERGRLVAAYAAVLEAQAAGAEATELDPIRVTIEKKLNKVLEPWKRLLAS